MKKLFLLITILALAFSAKAAVVEVYPTTPNATDNIRRAVRDNASAGDIIMLMSDADAYVESSDYMLLDKDVTIMPAEGKHPIIKMNRFAELLNSATVKFIGIKFDGSDAADASKGRCLRPYDTSTGKIVKFENCEFYGFKSHVIYCSAEFNLDSCIINNCYFHDNAMNAVYFYKSSDASVQTAKGVIITNSTFTNRGTGENGSVIEVRNQGTEPIVDDVELKVDHCTFYNNLFGEGDYSPIRSHKLGKMTVTNCIFAHPDAYAKYAVYAYGGSVSNCLTYNLTSGYKNWSPCPTLTDNITADPLFADAANGDFSLAGNWVTMNISPARNAGTDGSHLGDPRWHSAEVLPNVDFASPYQFVGEKALISGNIWYDGTNEYLYYDDESVCGTALWKIHAERACVLTATLNMNAGTTTGHIFRVEILDADGHSIGEVAEPNQSSESGNILMPGTLSIPAEGDYTVILHNDQSWSSAMIDGVTFSYIGGATANIPAEELVGEEAVLVDEGHLNVYKLANGDLQYDDNSTPLGEYVYWNINATKAGNMNVTLNVVAPASGHQFLVELYSDLNGAPIASTAEATSTSATGAIVLPDMNIPATGNYIIKLTNQTQWSSTILHSIQFEYAGGVVINIPDEEMIGEDAVIVDEGHKKVYKDADGNLQYDDNSTPLGEYVYWNINATKAGNMNVTLNVVAPASGHQFLVELYSDLSGAPIASTAEATSTSATGAIVLPDMNIPATGNYIIKLTNQTQWSSAILHSIEIKYAGGAVIDIPGQLLGEDALLYKTGSKYMIRTEESYLKSSNNGDPTSEWAAWNIAATAGTMNVTLNLDPVTSSGHNYRVELYDGVVLKDYAEELVSDELSAAVHTKGDILLEKTLVIPADGNYTIKLINRTQWSSMILHGITFTPVAAPTLVTMNDTDEDNTAWAANIGGAAVNVELTRSFTGGMYNTISLPFAVSSEKVIAAFGAGVELMYMTGATLDGTVLDLEFAPTTSIYQGTPYLIKPVADVVNPQFTGVEFVLSEASGSATGGTNADFIGTFVKTTIPGDPNNLYLQANNMLQFSQNDVTIKGTRAYFHVDVPSSALPVVRPRIVLNGQVLTDIELVNGEPQTNGKFIENGQLVIIRDGVRYNAIGIRVK